MFKVIISLPSSVFGLSSTGKVKKFNSKPIREFTGIPIRYNDGSYSVYKSLIF